MGWGRISLKNRARASNNGMTRRTICDSSGVPDMSAYLRYFGVLAVLGGLLLPSLGKADVVTKPGQLVVEDNGKVFSDAGITRAKDEFARLQSKTGRQVMVETLKEL